ncbi:protein of unknown function [Escherichia coli]|nr:protein of unknown function [Escherichia coli]CUU92774.1 hypothetical protein HMVEC_160025 [Escherichia coli]SJK87550.1 hypothetical protein RCEC007_210013 [Escherichia coli]VZZ87035.1 protein of unknown function [Escherichia coli]
MNGLLMSRYLKELGGQVCNFTRRT